jgi:hypothetical protein
MILLQVDLASGIDPRTVYEGCYEIENIYIFESFSIPDIGHYRWLHNLIRQLLPNTKADYLVRTIQHILNFLQSRIIAIA